MTLRGELVDFARACFGLGLGREAVALEAMRAGLGVVPTDPALAAGGYPASAAVLSRPPAADPGGAA